MFIKEVRLDPKIKKLHRMRESGAYATINTEELLTELKSLHGAKRIRVLRANKVLVGDTRMTLLDALLENQAHRSRVVEIKVECYKVQIMLEDHIKAAKRYLSTKYATTLQREFSTAKSRTEAVEHALSDFIELQTDLDLIIKIAEEVVKDTDAAYWTLAQVTKVLELGSRRPEV